MIRVDVRNAQPIPGRPVAWGEAIRAARTPLPRLRPIFLPDPCTGFESPVHLRSVWASGSVREWQVGVAYTHGLWMTLEAAANYNDASAPELRPLQEAFPRYDFPVGLENGAVRGHRAWIGELDPRFKCSRPTTNANGDWFIFDVTRTASLSWKERGVVVGLNGPFSARTLSSLASAMSWAEAKRSP